LKKPERAKKEKQPQPPQDFPSEELSRSRYKKPARVEEMISEEPAQRVEEQEGEMQEQAAYSQPNPEKESMDVEAGDEGMEATVEPIMVNLNECPSQEQLVELSSRLMTFRMNRIHNSTYIRIRKLLCPEEEPFPLIE